MSYITFTMPNPSASVACWIEFFTEIMQVDPTAPMHILMEHCKFVYDLQITLPPTPHQDVYQAVGIVMSADDERSANEAAIQSGIYAKGVAQLVDAVNAKNPYFGVYMIVLDVIVKDFDCNIIGIDVDVLSAAHSLVDGFRKEPQTSPSIERPSRNLPSRYDKRSWISCFECEMANDPCGSTSILSCFLKAVDSSYCSIFCPLGDARYCAIGEQMYKSPVVLKAAIQSGLMASAVPNYFEASLDVVENWHLMEGGVRFILASKKLRAFIPFELRFMAEEMLKAFPEGIRDDADEERWYTTINKLRDTLRIGTYCGY